MAIQDNGWPFNSNALGAVLGLVLIVGGHIAGGPAFMILGAWSVYCAGIAQICLTIKAER